MFDAYLLCIIIIICGMMCMITKMLMQFREEDVCKTMYSGGIKEETEVKPHRDKTTGSKVDTVCEAVRKELIKIGENKYLLSIVTTHVQMTKPELEIVLSMIERVKGQSAMALLYYFYQGMQS